MKAILLSLIFLGGIKFSASQSYSVVGAWIWSDSTEQISIFIRPSGTIQMHSGKSGAVILGKDLKNGKYLYERGMLIITWADNTVERLKIDFVENNSFTTDDFRKVNSASQKLTFKKVVDEEG